MMDSQTTLSVLRANRAALDEYSVASLALFGSVARDEADESSDVDILVEFSRPVGLFQFVRLQRFLTSLLGHSVDLVTPAALRDSMRDQILAEAIYA